ncbi:hypothetical protein [Halorussus caseinilyticus]|uniref:AbrB/MazE/SpoVT family DNA-binding domain-containing protein n=1 Tax=Halorussus caseinilyticus TaxID=3034025 RepID=A0ABD5WRU3_9EURY|nr:hypothetical protein [Halorussus sp. DT72]
MALKQEDDETAAEQLSRETGRPVEEFEPDFDEEPIPDASEQTWESTDEA